MVILLEKEGQQKKGIAKKVEKCMNYRKNAIAKELLCML